MSLDKFIHPTRSPESLPESIPPPPRARTANDPATTEIIVVKHIDAFLVRPILERELKGVPSARVRPDVRINALIITAPEAFIPLLAAIIDYLDDPRWLAFG